MSWHSPLRWLVLSKGVGLLTHGCVVAHNWCERRPRSDRSCMLLHLGLRASLWTPMRPIPPSSDVASSQCRPCHLEAPANSGSLFLQVAAAPFVWTKLVWPQVIAAVPLKFRPASALHISSRGVAIVAVAPATAQRMRAQRQAARTANPDCMACGQACARGP